MAILVVNGIIDNAIIYRELAKILEVNPNQIYPEIIEQVNYMRLASQNWTAEDVLSVLSDLRSEFIQVFWDHFNDKLLEIRDKMIALDKNSEEVSSWISNETVKKKLEEYIPKEYYVEDILIRFVHEMRRQKKLWDENGFKSARYNVWKWMKEDWKEFGNEKEFDDFVDVMLGLEDDIN